MVFLRKSLAFLTMLTSLLFADCVIKQRSPEISQVVPDRENISSAEKGLEGGVTGRVLPGIGVYTFTTPSLGALEDRWLDRIRDYGLNFEQNPNKWVKIPPLEVSTVEPYGKKLLRFRQRHPEDHMAAIKIEGVPGLEGWQLNAYSDPGVAGKFYVPGVSEIYWKLPKDGVESLQGAAYQVISFARSGNGALYVGASYTGRLELK